MRTVKPLSFAAIICFADVSTPAFQALFRDESKSEFVVVTIPSMLAVAETERLVEQLRAQVRLYVGFSVAFTANMLRMT